MVVELISSSQVVRVIRQSSKGTKGKRRKSIKRERRKTFLKALFLEN
jgi:hypothetical protein